MKFWFVQVQLYPGQDAHWEQQSHAGQGREQQLNCFITDVTYPSKLQSFQTIDYTKVINSVHDFDAPTAEPDQPGPHPGPRPEGGIIQISHSLPGNSYTLPGNSYTLPGNAYSLPGNS